MVSPVSVRCQSGVSPVSAQCQSGVSPVSVRCQPGVSPVLAQCQPSVSPVSVQCQCSVSPVSAQCQPSVSPVSVQCQSSVSPVSVSDEWVWCTPTCLPLSKVVYITNIKPPTLCCLSVADSKAHVRIIWSFLHRLFLLLWSYKLAQYLVKLFKTTAE